MHGFCVQKYSKKRQKSDKKRIENGAMLFSMEKRCLRPFFLLRGRSGSCPGAALASPEGSREPFWPPFSLPEEFLEGVPVNCERPLGARRGSRSHFERFWFAFKCPRCLLGAISGVWGVSWELFRDNFRIDYVSFRPMLRTH